MHSSTVTGAGDRRVGQPAHELDRALPGRGIDRPEAVGVRVVVLPGVDRGPQDRELRVAVGRELGDPGDRRLEALLGVGGDLLHGPAGGRDERRGSRRAFGPSSVACPTISPLPGSWASSGRASTTVGVPGELEPDRLVVDEPGRRVDHALLQRGELAEVGERHDRRRRRA